MLAFCPTHIHIQSIIQSEVMYINNTRRSAKVHLQKIFSIWISRVRPRFLMAILPPPPTMPSFHTSPVLAPKQQSFWPQQSLAPGTLKDENYRTGILPWNPAWNYHKYNFKYMLIYVKWILLILIRRRYVARDIVSWELLSQWQRSGIQSRSQKCKLKQQDATKSAWEGF